jgi:hypothetical protein
MLRGKRYGVCVLLGSAVLVTGVNAAESQAGQKRLFVRLPEQVPVYLLPQPKSLAVLKNGRAEMLYRQSCNCRELSARENTLRRLPARTLQSAPGVKIASTSYDWQTNFLIKNRTVWSSDDKVLQLVWMSGSGDPAGGWPDRGTYYAAVDLTDPTNPQVVPTQRGWTRIEPVRTGWPAAAGLPNGALAFVSHTPLRFGKNNGVLDEGWQVSDLGPAGSLWPYLTSTADGTLHVVYTYSSGANAGQVGYRRSTDQGQTWSDEIFLSGGDAPAGVAGADHYIIEAGGGLVVAAYYAILREHGTAVVLRASSDNGATWTSAMPLAAGTFSQVYQIGQSDTAVYVSTDTIPMIDNYSLIVDAQGQWHLFATLIAGYMTGTVLNSQPTDTAWTVQVAGIYPVAAYGASGMNQPMTVQLPPPVLSNGRLVTVLNTIASGYVDRIKLGLDDAGNLYAVLSAPKEGDTFQPQGDTVVYGYSHLWLLAKTGSSWTQPENLTPDGLDCNFATASKGGPEGYAVIVYQAGVVPGSFVQGAVWEAGKEDEIYVLAYGLPTSVRERAEAAGADLRVQPNPVATTGYIQLGTAEAGRAVLELYSPVGSKVRTLFEGWLEANEVRHVRLDASELSSGVYHLLLRFNGSTVSRQVIVVR